MASNLLVILDLDETLVHSPDQAEALPGVPDFWADHLPVFVRPYAREALDQIVTEHLAAVWTAASGPYAQAIVDELLGERAQELQFVWAAERCTTKYDPVQQEHFQLKNLDKLRRRGFKLENIAAVDDSPEKLSKHYGNHIPIAPWRGEAGDDWLKELVPFLRWLATRPSVRKVEKRGWKTSERMRFGV